MCAVGRRPFVFLLQKGPSHRPCVKVVTKPGLDVRRELGRAATRRVKRSCLARGHISEAVTAAYNDVEGGRRVGEGAGRRQSPLAMERERRIVSTSGCRRDTETRPYGSTETLEPNSSGRESLVVVIS
jgi:hypothetical protein